MTSLPYRCLWLPILLHHALLGVGPGFAGERQPEPVPVHLEVEAVRSVADLDKRELTHALVVALTSEERCPVRLVDEPDQASIRVHLQLQRWLDRRTPDGVPQFDRRTGRDLPGHQYEIWGVYDFEIRVSGEEKPVEQEKDERFRSRARESRNPMFDARARALKEAHERVIRDIVPDVCRQARKGVPGPASGS